MTTDYNLTLTIAEAALRWAGLPRDLLLDDLRDGIPVIHARPDVADRGVAILEAIKAKKLPGRLTTSGWLLQQPDLQQWLGTVPEPPPGANANGYVSRYQQCFSITEAVLTWSQLPLATKVVYLTPGMPELASNPAVHNRAAALVAAIRRGDVPAVAEAPSPRDPECERVPLPIERWSVRRADLFAWVAQNWPQDVSSAAVVEPPKEVRRPQAPPAPPADRLLSGAEVLAALGCSRATLDRMIKKEKFPAHVAGYKAQWHNSTVQEWLAAKKMGVQLAALATARAKEAIKRAKEQDADI